jgi:hypothetical protein
MSFEKPVVLDLGIDAKVNFVIRASSFPYLALHNTYKPSSHPAKILSYWIVKTWIGRLGLLDWEIRHGGRR